MKWLEIIELRAVHIDQNMLQQHIAHLLDEMKDANTVKVYINVRIETDWSIHVQHNSEEAEAHGSEVGRRFKELLKEFGLVNHVVWMEQKL